VTDNLGARASQAFSVLVNIPSLTITTPATLPGGTVGISYTQKFAVVGGTAPYTWILSDGSIPGLVFDAQQAQLTATPTLPGSFTINLQARDSAGISVTKSFSITINPSPLRLMSNTQLPDAAISSPFFYQLAAAGGVPPYTWSANGLPEGLTLDAQSGTITGKPAVSGSLTFTVRVTDSVRTGVLDLFRLNVSLPPAPAASFAGLPELVDAARQFTLQVALQSPFPAPITVRAILTFTPEIGGADGTIQFASGGQTTEFTIPAGE